MVAGEKCELKVVDLRYSNLHLLYKGAGADRVLRAESKVRIISGRIDKTFAHIFCLLLTEYKSDQVMIAIRNSDIIQERHLFGHMAKKFAITYDEWVRRMLPKSEKIIMCIDLITESEFDLYNCNYWMLMFGGRTIQSLDQERNMTETAWGERERIRDRWKCGKWINVS